MSDLLKGALRGVLGGLLRRQTGLDISATAPKTTDYANGARRVRFVGMQHIARPAFYEAAAEAVRAAKEDGYVHFYELIDVYALSDPDQRKLRKLTQRVPMPDQYAEVARQMGEQLGVELVAQDQQRLVGLVNDRDVNADIAPQELLARVESALGPLDLTQEDLETPLSEAISIGIPAERWMPVVLDGRNLHLATCVHEATDERIVITYGAAHEPGWLAELQRLEPGWAAVEE